MPSQTHMNESAPNESGPTDSDLPFLRAARAHPERHALFVGDAEHTYGDLLSASERVARFLLRGRADLEEARVVLLVPPGFEYVAAHWGIWRAGGVVVPLGLAHPAPELTTLVEDADPELVLLHAGTEERGVAAAEANDVPHARVEKALASPEPAQQAPASPEPAHDAPSRPAEDAPPLPTISESRQAHIIYTSGTTGKPKGVVTTHANTRVQIRSIGEAWKIESKDRVLNALPLHHVHGIVNALLCPLWYGAMVEILPRFDAEKVWERFETLRAGIFMGVPTMYARLIEVWLKASPERQRTLSRRAAFARLMISGSAPLPEGVFWHWNDITNHRILERYGLTETGMVLSSPLIGPRAPGHVGQALPGVAVRLVADDGTAAEPGQQGTIEVRGGGVFREYWRRPEETAAAFRDGWFRTGDAAIVDKLGYRILGREGIDILKTGGEKVSALEVEEALLEHRQVRECAVVGLPNEVWGEQVAAAVVYDTDGPEDPARLREWAKERIAAYKAPTHIMVMKSLPRNSMGKVLKTKLRDLFIQHGGDWPHKQSVIVDKMLKDALEAPFKDVLDPEAMYKDAVNTEEIYQEVLLKEALEEAWPGRNPFEEILGDGPIFEEAADADADADADKDAQADAHGDAGVDAHGDADADAPQDNAPRENAPDENAPDDAPPFNDAWDNPPFNNPWDDPPDDDPPGGWR